MQLRALFVHDTLPQAGACEIKEHLFKGLSAERVMQPDPALVFLALKLFGRIHLIDVWVPHLGTRNKFQCAI